MTMYSSVYTIEELNLKVIKAFILYNNIFPILHGEDREEICSVICLVIAYYLSLSEPFSNWCGLQCVEGSSWSRPLISPRPPRLYFTESTRGLAFRRLVNSMNLHGFTLFKIFVFINGWNPFTIEEGRRQSIRRHPPKHLLR